MRTRAERVPARLVPLLWLTALMTVLAWAGATPATAHDVLVGSDPADGATVEGPPSRVVLTFSAEQMALGHAFEVTDPDGVDHVVGEATVEGRELVQELDGLGPAGTWTVAWRSVSSDGHPISGTFTFAVAAAAAVDDGDAAGGTSEDEGGTTTGADASSVEEGTVAVEDDAAAAQTPGAGADPQEQEPATDGSASGAPDPLLVGGIAVGAVAAAVLVLAVLRRRAVDGQEGS